MVHRPSLWDFINAPRNKYQVYLFFNKPRTWLAIAYQIAIIVLICVCILITMFMSRDEGSPTSYIVLFWFDLTMLIIFTFEFFLRAWATTVLPRYSGQWGWVKIMYHPIYIIDMTIIGMTIACMVLDVHMQQLSAGLRGFRMVNIFENRYRMWRLIWKAVWSERFQLAVACYFCIVWLFGFGFMMYFIEQPYNHEFDTVANSCWWAVVTFTTVGYGNAAPSTTAGKIVTAFAMLIGVGLFALPAGIIGSSLALKVEEDTGSAGGLRQNYGAILLQNAWKVYWIGKRQQYRRPSRPPVIVRVSSHDGGLQFGGSPTAPPLDMRPYYNSTAVQFVFLLKFHLFKRRFRLAEEINDSKNFYETYMQTSWQEINMILSLQTSIERLQDTMNETKLRLDEAIPRRTPRAASHHSSLSGSGRGPGDDDDNDDNNDDQGGDGAAGGSEPQGSKRGSTSSTHRSQYTSATGTSSTTFDSGTSQYSQRGGQKRRSQPRRRRRLIPPGRLARSQRTCWKCLQARRAEGRKKRSFTLPRSPLDVLDALEPLMELDTPRESTSSASSTVSAPGSSSASHPAYLSHL